MVAISTNILISGINTDYKQPQVNSGQIVPPNKFAANLRKNNNDFQSFLDLVLASAAHIQSFLDLESVDNGL